MEAKLCELPALRAEVLELQARLDALGGPRDSADAAVVPALARAFGAEGFTARAAVARSRIDPDLAAVLDDACVQSTKEVGWLLSRLQARDLGGFRVELRKRRESGHV